MFDIPMTFVVHSMIKEMAEKGEIGPPQWITRVCQAPGCIVRRISAMRRTSGVTEPSADAELAQPETRCTAQ